MAKLVFDIETVGEKFDDLDKKSQEYLLRFTETEEEKEAKKESLGFSPLTGQVISIAILNPETNQGKVFFQAPGKKIVEEIKDGISFIQTTEEQMLNKFWELAKSYNEFITFAGRTFDVPYLCIRSAIYGIRPSKNLLKNRYLNLQNFDAVHVDLLDQLTFYGATRWQKLHFFCRAFGIESPKEGEVTGEEMAQAFEAGKYQEIAYYCLQDVVATAKLYEYWDKYLRF